MTKAEILLEMFTKIPWKTIELLFGGPKIHLRHYFSAIESIQLIQCKSLLFSKYKIMAFLSFTMKALQ